MKGGVEISSWLIDHSSLNSDGNHGLHVSMFLLFVWEMEGFEMKNAEEIRGEGEET